jgi:hypothetical protein
LLAPEIDPRLIHRGMWGYGFRQYGLALFKPSLGTTQIGRAANDPPDGKTVNRRWVDAELNAADAPSPTVPN